MIFHSDGGAMDEDLKQQLKNWQEIAVYLADCHAATAGYDGELKTTSKSRRARFASICRTAEISLKSGCLVGVRTNGTNEIERVIYRCRINAERMDKLNTTE